MTVQSFAQLLNGGRPDDTIIAQQNQRPLTLGELRGRVAVTAAALAGRRAANVLLICEDSATFLIGLLSAAVAGCRTILPPNAQPATLRSFASAVDTVMSDRALAEIDKLLVLAGHAPPASEPLTPQPIAIDFFTSGSTGAMKRVEKSLRALEREGETLEMLWGATLGKGHVVGTVSHQHIFGLAFKVVWPFLGGHRFSGECHFAWESLLRDLDPGGAIVTSPAHLTRLGGLSPLVAARQPRLIFTAGAPLPAAAARETAAIFGIAPVEIFGSTETSALAWRQGPSDTPLWQPLPGVAAKASDDGLLEVCSPFIVGDERCRLSDRVAFEPDGRFRFLGRADRVVKIEGKRVNILELEERIQSLPWIRRAVVATLAEPYPQLGVVADLTTAGAAALAQLGKFRFVRALRRDLLHTHDAAILPRQWRFVDEIPTDRMGKSRARDIAALLNVP